MKIKLLIAVLALVVCMAFPMVEAKPDEITIQINQAQFQCRLWDPPGWRDFYNNYATSFDFNLTGNVLHTEISYQPAVSEEEGTSMVYVYNKKEELWILHEGTIQYLSPYSGLWITEYWKGYLNFTGVPSQESFEHGVGYQWGYVFGDDPRWYYTYATWDETMGAWFLGFSIYLWDPDPQSYTPDDVPFPGLIEPVPKSDYNPCDH